MYSTLLYYVVVPSGPSNLFQLCNTMKQLLLYKQTKGKLMVQQSYSFFLFIIQFCSCLSFVPTTIDGTILNTILLIELKFI